jgi:uncharacterized protein
VKPSPITVFGIVLAIGGSAILSAISGRVLASNDHLVARMLVFEAAWWLLGAGVAVVVVREHQGWGSIGWRRPDRATWLWGVIAGVVLTVALPVFDALVAALGLTGSGPTIDQLSKLPMWLLLAGAVRAGVVEELLFRGYLIERLGSWTGRRWLGALISLVIFVVLHLGSWDVGHLFYVTFAGGVLTVLYMVRRDLPCNMIAHTLCDGLSFLLNA